MPLMTMNMKGWSGVLSHSGLVIAQFGFGLAALATLVAPPAEGVMVLVPMTRQAAMDLPRLIFHGDTRLVGRGAIPGSLVVYGRRSDLAFPLLAHAILSMANPSVLCGPTGAGA